MTDEIDDAAAEEVDVTVWVDEHGPAQADVVEKVRWWCVMHNAAIAQYFDPETVKGQLLGHEPELCQANKRNERIRECFFSRLPLDETTQEIMRQQVEAESRRI